MIYKSYEIEENNKNLLQNKSILFYGENLGQKKYFKDNIKESNPNTDFLNFTQDDIIKDENILAVELNNLSLFGNKKIIFIEGCNDKIFLKLEKSFERKTDVQIILFAEILDKKSKLRNYYEKSKIYFAVACYQDNELSIKKIILKKLKGFEGLSTINVNIIIESVNLDRIKLENELSKIMTFFQNKKINTDQLEKLLDNKINDNFNVLKDEALMGNKIKTNKLLSDTIIDTEKNILYLNLINQRLNKLYEIIQMSQTSNISEALSSIRPPVFWKDKPNFTIQANKWSLNTIKNVLTKTYNLEIEIKSNSIINKNILIKKLLIDICELANA